MHMRQTKDAFKPQQDFSNIIEYLLEPFDCSYRGGGEYRSRCPIHKGNNPTSFRVDAHTGKWSCFGCGGWGYLQKLVEQMLRLPAEQAQTFLADAPRRRLRLDKLNLPQPQRGRRKKPVEEDNIGLKDKDILNYKQLCPVSLVERGFSPTVLQRFEVGYDKQSARVVFPLRACTDSKPIVGLTYRYDYGVEGPKYDHEIEKKAEHLYGLWLFHRKRVKTLWICEGHLDCIRLCQFDEAAVAIMGCFISVAQLSLLRNVYFEHLVYAMDADGAGIDGTRYAIPMLLKNGYGSKLRIVNYAPGIKDPGEITSLSQVKTISWWEWQIQNPKSKIKAS